MDGRGELADLPGTLSDASTIGGNIDDAVLGDFDKDGVIDVVSLNNSSGSASVLSAVTTEVSTQAALNITTAEYARTTLDSLKETLQSVAAERGLVGSLQSRLGVALRVNESFSLEFQAAASRIQDADIASEVAESVRLRVREQALTAVIAQANLSSELVLKLLKG